MSSNDSQQNTSKLNDKIALISQQYQNDEWDTSYYFFKKHKDYLKGPKSKSFRFLTPGIPDKKVLDNRIETSKYNLITFLPKNLYIQFSKLAHVYFIIIGICQMVREISTTDGKPAIFLPFSIITIVCMIKDFIEDRQRHNADRKENESKCKRMNMTTHQFEEVFWQSLNIGDIVKIDEEEQFPADLIVLKTTLTNGDCYVETKNLDGETNLKRKVGFAPSIMQKIEFTDSEQLIQYQLKYEQPNQQMYYFNGIMTNNQSGNQYSLNINNICLRGSSLKATDSIYGMVIYTGHQSKIHLNSQKARYKFSKIELMMNKMILWIFMLLLTICLFSSSYYQIWVSKMEDQLSYLKIKNDQFDGNNAQTFFLFIPLWILLLGHFVPISLIVTLEIVKFSQGLILQRDRNFKNINDDQYVDVKSSNLCEELGRVKYIFSDKTGTLTINQMNFKALCLNQKIYEKKDESIHLNTILQSDELDKVLFEQAKGLVKYFYTFLIYQQFINQQKEIEGMYCINLCHTLIIERKDDKLIFNGTSPDEESIMDFCYHQGFYFSDEDINSVMTITSKKFNAEMKFEKISVLEFDFERKKMSVIVKDLQTQEYKLYCKGADMNIFQICAPGQDKEIQTTTSALHYFAVKGLRTLAFGYKVLTKQEVDRYLSRLAQIKEEITDQEEKVQKLNIEMEQNLILLGGTGINDRLQDDVEYTLKNLKTAGIKIWMLTGDKVETAQNIAQQCHLVSEQTDLMMINQEKFSIDMETLIDQYYEKIGKSTYSVMITGYSLYALDNHFNPHNIIRFSQENISMDQNKQPINARNKLLQVLLNSETVIACKVTPKQKAELVSIIKKLKPDATTLAIGDGANDVSMITTAHVGVGIRGKEGRQAAKISDFSIGEFRHLNRLILYYGQETYRKNTQLVFFNFYKNQVGFLVYFWYNFFAGQCGTYFYDQWVKQLYNLIYTALPIILYCLFDEMYPAHEYCTIFQTLPNKLEKMPLFYKRNLQNPSFTIWNFWKEFFKGSFQSIVITLIGLMCINDTSDKKQRQASHLEIGMLVFTMAVIAPNLRVFQLHKTHYPFTLFFIFGGIAMFFISLLVASKIKQLDSFGMTESLLGVGNTYIGLFMMITTVYCFQRAFDDWYQFSEQMKPQDCELVVEKEEKKTIISSDQKSQPQSSQQNMIEIISINNNVDYIDEVNINF